MNNNIVHFHPVPHADQYQSQQLGNNVVGTSVVKCPPVCSWSWSPGRQQDRTGKVMDTKTREQRHRLDSDSGRPAVCPHHHHHQILQSLRLHKACRVTVPHRYTACSSILCWTQHYPLCMFNNSTSTPISHTINQTSTSPPTAYNSSLYQASLAAVCLSPDLDHAPLLLVAFYGPRGTPSLA